MECDKCGKTVKKEDNIFEKKFSEDKRIAVHKSCAKKTGGLDYFHGLRHTVWPSVSVEHKKLKQELGQRFN